MAGIYLHIPFCSQACHYCNFHFSTSLKQKDSLIESMIREIELQGSFLSQPIRTIYFGGGTPSVLSISEIESLINAINKVYATDAVEEITLEANPEDLTREYCNGLKQLGINRLSIGIQSFFDEDLEYMNRVHHAGQSFSAITNALYAGLNNLTIDLIYGQPWSDENKFRQNLHIFSEFDLPHLSAYALTVEPKTALAYQVKKAQVPAPRDEQALSEFQLLQSWSKDHGTRHYEISNLCKPGHVSIHNTSYWRGDPYLGIGPSAHSFSEGCRYWNISNNANYIRSISAGQLPVEKEVLSASDRYNEIVMTGMRLDEGICLDHIRKIGSDYEEYLMDQSKSKLAAGLLREEKGYLILADDQRFFADGHASDLFRVD